MIAPLDTWLPLSGAAGLLVAFGVGIVFGFLLERGGLGNARKLAGQFYLTDFTVLRVMFTAIVTAMIGLFWLSRFGVLDLGAVRLVPTYVLPQLVGGVIFGIGFVCASLCPGTSCVAAVTGKLDGLVTLLGILVGIFLFAESFAGFRGFLYSTSLGQVTGPELLGLPHGVLVLAVVLIALGAFLAAEAVSRGENLFRSGRIAHRRALSSTPGRLALLALALALSAAFVGHPTGAGPGLGDSLSGGAVEGARARYLDPLELAAWIVAKKDDFELLDLRPRAEFDRYHIPFARHVSGEDLESELPAARKKVVLCMRDTSVPQEVIGSLASHHDGDLLLLWGGMRGWAARVLFPDLTRSRSLGREEKARIGRVSRYFGGAPVLLEEDVERTPGRYVREGC